MWKSGKDVAGLYPRGTHLMVQTGKGGGSEGHGVHSVAGLYPTETASFYFRSTSLEGVRFKLHALRAGGKGWYAVCQMSERFHNKDN